MVRSIALVLKGYPRLSETFIAQEIRQLELRGLDITIVSLRHPTDNDVHPIHREITAPVIYLPEYLHQEPWRVIKGLLYSLGKPGFFRSLGTWLKDLKRDFSRNRVRRFGQALVLTRELPENTQHLYAHFIHTPASVTRYSSQIADIPWSASAHAKDIWTIPEWEIKEKLDDLKWLATCTRANVDYLRPMTLQPDKVQLIYHGLDFSRFGRGFDAEPRNSDDSSSNENSNKSGINQLDNSQHKPIEIISVGRAVPKKGYDHLLNALANLPNELSWQLTHIGGGELLKPLQQQAQQLGIEKRIKWMGALPQEQVLSHYRSADLFVLASKINEDGDRDGLPNVLMEAQSQGLCCLSTRISGIPELIVDGETGLLVEQKNEQQLTNALLTLITNPALRTALGQAGYKRVTEEFSVDKGIDKLMQQFNSTAPSLAANKTVAG